MAATRDVLTRTWAQLQLLVQLRVQPRDHNGTVQTYVETQSCRLNESSPTHTLSSQKDTLKPELYRLEVLVVTAQGP